MLAVRRHLLELAPALGQATQKRRHAEDSQSASVYCETSRKLCKDTRGIVQYFVLTPARETLITEIQPVSSSSSSSPSSSSSSSPTATAPHCSTLILACLLLTRRVLPAPGRHHRVLVQGPRKEKRPEVIKHGLGACVRPAPAPTPGRPLARNLARSLVRRRPPRRGCPDARGVGGRGRD